MPSKRNGTAKVCAERSGTRFQRGLCVITPFEFDVGDRSDLTDLTENDV